MRCGKYKSFKEWIKEDGNVPCNNAGAGQIAGIGVGPNGEPGVKPKKKKKVVMGMVARKPQG